MPDTTEFWAQCLREALLDPVTAGQVEAGPGGRAGFFLNLLSLPSYGRYQHSDEDMLAAHDGTCTCGWPAAPSRCPRTTRTRLLRSAPDGDTTYLILDALAARPWVRFLLTFGPGVLASTEDQAPGWHLALPLSSRPAGLSRHEYIRADVPNIRRPTVLLVSLRHSGQGGGPEA